MKNNLLNISIVGIGIGIFLFFGLGRFVDFAEKHVPRNDIAILPAGDGVYCLCDCDLASPTCIEAARKYQILKVMLVRYDGGSDGFRLEYMQPCEKEAR